MAAYIWVETTVHDATKMPNYIANVRGTLERHGGRMLINTNKATVIEGNVGQHPTKVLIEFPSVEAARSWYDSPEYQDILDERLQAATANLMIVEGVKG